MRPRRRARCPTSRLPQRLRARGARRSPGGAARGLQGGRARARPRAGGPRHGRARSTWTCCCSATSSTARSGLTLPHPEVTAGASCSSRCSSSIPSCACPTARSWRERLADVATSRRARGPAGATPKRGGAWRCCFRDRTEGTRWRHGRCSRWRAFGATTTPRSCGRPRVPRRASGRRGVVAARGRLRGRGRVPLPLLRLRSHGLPDLRADAPALARRTPARNPTPR